MIVEFSNVGRDKKSWTATTDDLSINWFRKQIRKHNALMSHDIEIGLNEVEDTITGGVIVVGLFRVVGTFKVEARGTR